MEELALAVKPRLDWRIDLRREILSR